MSKLRKAFILGLLASLFLLAPMAIAQEDDVDDNQVNEIAKDIYCPVCESTPLDVCPTQACADWRSLIRTQLAEGQSKEQIFDYFARQYGDGVLANPPRRGLSLFLVWLLPAALVLAALLLFAWYIRSLRTEPAETRSDRYSSPVVGPTASGTGSMDYQARVEEELRQGYE